MKTKVYGDNKKRYALIWTIKRRVAGVPLCVCPSYDDTIYYFFSNSLERVKRIYSRLLHELIQDSLYYDFTIFDYKECVYKELY